MLNTKNMVNKMLGRSNSMLGKKIISVKRQKVKTIRRQDDRWSQLKNFIERQGQFSIYSNYLDSNVGWKRRKIKLISRHTVDSDDMELTGNNLFTYSANLKSISAETAKIIRYAEQIVDFAKQLYGNDFLKAEESSGFTFHLNFDIHLRE